VQKGPAVYEGGQAAGVVARRMGWMWRDVGYVIRFDGIVTAMAGQACRAL
jgi:hypothetical protein